MEKTVAFYGGDSQTGTTMLAVSTAVLMARQGKRVLMIAASDHSGDLWIPTAEGNFLDDLLTDLQEHSLTWEKIRQYILTEAGVDFLPGIRENHRDDFHEKDLSQICWLAEMHYDRILVDCGCGPATGLTAAAVRSGERAVVVITQQEKCLLRLQKKMQMLDRLLPPQRLYAVNKYHDSRAFYTKKELAQKLECMPGDLIPIPYVPYGWQAEMEQRTLLRYRSFQNAVKRMAYRLEGGDEIGDSSAAGRKIRRILSALPHGGNDF